MSKPYMSEKVPESEPIPQEFKNLWMSLYRAALCGQSVDEEGGNSPRLIAAIAAKIADEALEEVRRRFF